MQVNRLDPKDDSHFENLRHLGTILEALAIWRYRVHSTLLVASSALLALSFSLLPAEDCTSSIEATLYPLLVLCNVLQLLSATLVLGITLGERIALSNNATKELIRPSSSRHTLVYNASTALRKTLIAAEYASFAFFVATILILAVCRILLMA